MSELDIEYLEKVAAPTYRGYGWGNAADDMLKLIAEVRRLRGQLQEQAEPSERSDEGRPA